MDRNTKAKVADALVTIDDAIATSNGIADLLGKVITSFVGGFFNAPLDINKESVKDSPQIETEES